MKCLLGDLMKVPFSAELAASLQQLKLDVKTIMDTLNKETTVENCDLNTKKDAMAKCNKSMKPIVDAIKRRQPQGSGCWFEA